MRAHSNDGAHFRMLLAPKLEKIDAGLGIDLVSIEATQVGPLKGTQPGFAEEGVAAYDPGPLVDALPNRLGEEAVCVLAAHGCWSFRNGRAPRYSGCARGSNGSEPPADAQAYFFTGMVLAIPSAPTNTTNRRIALSPVFLPLCAVAIVSISESPL